MVTVGDFVGLKPSSKELNYSHQKFVDDSIVMEEALVRNARNIKNALEDYGQASGQIINFNKSVIYFINANDNRHNKIKIIIGCEIGTLLGSYLGLPLCMDPLEIFWSSLIDKIHLKLARWKGSLLSWASKVIALKSIL